MAKIETKLWNKLFFGQTNDHRSNKYPRTGGLFSHTVDSKDWEVRLMAELLMSGAKDRDIFFLNRSAPSLCAYLGIDYAMFMEGSRGIWGEEGSFMGCRA